MTTTPATADPAVQAPVRWGLGDVAIGLLAGEVLSLVAFVFVAGSHHYATGGASGPGAAFGQVLGHLAAGQAPAFRAPMPLWLTALLQIPLWACLLGVPLLATITKGRGPRIDLKLSVRALDVPVGLAIGVAGQVVLVPVIYWVVFRLIGNQDVSAVARQLTDRATDPLSIVLLLLIVGVGAPVAEEVFFRGLTQGALERRFTPTIALWGTAAFFALTHFEPLQFPALLAFGLVLGLLVRRSGRLGPAIFAHIGFNLTAAAALVWRLPFVS